MIEFHADDYGMFPEAARRIIACIDGGCINGISLMPNAPCFEECMEILKNECHTKVRLSVHLNLMTERPLCDKSRIPDLTDEEGYFCLTYGKLLLSSLFPKKRANYKKQIKEELALQIERCLPYLNDSEGIRLDSHRHFHMVPVVFDAIAELAAEKDYNLSYIRIIRERAALYHHLFKFESFRPVNVIKAVLLNYLGFIDRRRHRRLYDLGTADFGSILFSGCMTESNLSLLVHNHTKNAGHFREDLELMFHPGAVLEKEDLMRIHDAEDAAYMADPMRLKEQEAVCSFTVCS